MQKLSRRVDVFGNIYAKPIDNSTALSPQYQGAKEFSLYHEGLDKEVGTVEVAPYDAMLGEEFIELELDEEMLEEDESEVYLSMEHAEEAINEFYRENFPSMENARASNLGLVEKAEQILEGNRQKQNSGMYEF